MPEHSVDLHAACPRCLAAEASKPGAKDGEFLLFLKIFYKFYNLDHLKKLVIQICMNKVY